MAPWSVSSGVLRLLIPALHSITPRLFLFIVILDQSVDLHSAMPTSGWRRDPIGWFSLLGTEFVLFYRLRELAESGSVHAWRYSLRRNSWTGQLGGLVSGILPVEGCFACPLGPRGFVRTEGAPFTPAYKKKVRLQRGCSPEPGSNSRS